MVVGNFREYKGYTGTIEFDNGVYHGRILHIDELITYSSNDVCGLRKEFERVVKFCLVDKKKKFTFKDFLEGLLLVEYL